MKPRPRVLKAAATGTEKLARSEPTKIWVGFREKNFHVKYFFFFLTIASAWTPVEETRRIVLEDDRNEVS